jgi:hypothetical protein
MDSCPSTSSTLFDGESANYKQFYLKRERLEAISAERKIDDSVAPLFCLRCHPDEEERLYDLTDRVALGSNEQARTGRPCG